MVILILIYTFMVFLIYIVHMHNFLTRYAEELALLQKNLTLLKLERDELLNQLSTNTSNFTIEIFLILIVFVASISFSYYFFSTVANTDISIKASIDSLAAGQERIFNALVTMDDRIRFINDVNGQRMLDQLYLINSKITLLEAQMDVLFVTFQIPLYQNFL